MFLYIGNKNLFDDGGIDIFYYSEESGELKWIDRQFPNISAGYMCVDEKNGWLFCVNERIECRGIPGGEVYCFKIDNAKGKLIFISKMPTHTTLPCYVHFISKQNQLLVCNHAKRDWSLKLERDSTGTLYGRKVYDSAALEVFDISSNGEIIGPTNIWEAPFVNTSSENPHLHSIIYDENSDLFYMGDTGSDLIHIMSLKNKDTLLHIDSVNPAHNQSTPRYGVFHPTLPILYFNSEKKNALFALKIRGSSLIPFQEICVEYGREKIQGPLEQSAIAVNHAGNILYSLIRKTKSVSVFAIDKDGTLKFLQSFCIGYDSPRALLITPNDKNMFVVCSNGKCLVRIDINDDGTLCKNFLEETSLLSPSCITIYTPNSK